MPVSLVHTVILPARLDDYQPALLDALLATGEWVWQGLAGDRVAFMHKDNVGLVESASEDSVLDPADVTVLTFLQRGGGWRTNELVEALSIGEEALRTSLARLAHNGSITNDAFAPARQFSREPKAGGGSQRRPGRPRLPTRRSVHEGRWSALRPSVQGHHAREVIDILLRRYGVIAKEMVSAENWRASWAELRLVLDEYETRGDLRRGYFVEGLSGIQFATASTVDLLREGLAPVSENGAQQPGGQLAQELLHYTVMAATDPANPWGSVLSFRGIRRSVGAWLVLEDGLPILQFEGRRLTPLSDRPIAGFQLAVEALGQQLPKRPFRGKHGVAIEHWGDQSVLERLDELDSLFAPADVWLRTPKGFRLSR